MTLSSMVRKVMIAIVVPRCLRSALQRRSSGENLRIHVGLALRGRWGVCEGQLSKRAHSEGVQKDSGSIRTSAAASPWRMGRGWKTSWAIVLVIERSPERIGGCGLQGRCYKYGKACMKWVVLHRWTRAWTTSPSLLTRPHLDSCDEDRYSFANWSRGLGW